MCGELPWLLRGRPALRFAGAVVAAWRAEAVEEGVDAAQGRPADALAQGAADHAAQHGPDEGADDGDRDRHRADLRSRDDARAQAGQATQLLIALLLFVLHG